LYNNYREKNPDDKITHETFRLIFKSTNISFAKLGEEECEDCEEFTNHKCSEKKEGDKDKQENSEDNREGLDEDTQQCQICQDHKDHLERAATSRENYTLAVSKNDPETSYFSIDMQKILMLLHLPGLKTALFTRRIILINQSIAPLHSFKVSGNAPRGFLWHEGIQGRNDEDVASVVIKFLKTYPRDCKNVVIWCDNCSGQNKNWTLYSSVVHHVFANSHVEKVTFKYFDKGHTFMSADSFHHLVEKKIREKNILYDFSDYYECVDTAGKACLMMPEEFYAFENKKSSAKDTNYPKL